MEESKAEFGALLRPQTFRVPRRTASEDQFFGVKAAQERIAKKEGGVIWHTQGSG